MSAIRKFHKDEEGLEALQVVMIVAVAAVILALIVNWWDDIRKFFEKAVKNITEFETGGQE